MKLKSVEIGVLTTRRLRSKESGRRFLDLLMATAPAYAPERFNTYEPVTVPYVTEDAVARWGSSFLWRRSKPAISGQVVFGPDTAHDAIYLSMPLKAFDRGTLESWLGAIESEFGIELAYVHGRTDSDSEDVERYRRHLMPFSQGLTTHHLREGLPGFPWAMMLGPTYVDHFGQDRILSAPAVRIVPVGRAILLQLTDEVSDVALRRMEYLAIQEEVERHLGRRSFRSEGLAEVPQFFPSFH